MKKEQAVGFVQQLIYSERMCPILNVLLGPDGFPEVISYSNKCSPTWIKNPVPVAKLLREVAEALEQKEPS